MGIRNCLIEGVSCSGKTAVCDELQRRGHHCIHGDRELAFCGDPETGEALHADAAARGSWIWDVDRVRSLAADRSHAVTFFCGGSRNSAAFLDAFDTVIVLELDASTLDQRLAARAPEDWGGAAAESEAFARRQHRTREGFPEHAVAVDATAPLSRVVDRVLAEARGQAARGPCPPGAGAEAAPA